MASLSQSYTCRINSSTGLGSTTVLVLLWPKLHVKPSHLTLVVVISTGSFFCAPLVCEEAMRFMSMLAVAAAQLWIVSPLEILNRRRPGWSSIPWGCVCRLVTKYEASSTRF